MSKTILLIGGHGKISLLLTPLLLSRSWNVTSLIRDGAQKPAILAAGGPNPHGQLSILVSSLEETTTEASAAAILERVNPDYIVWSAGAGGKGGAARTYAVDRDAAKAYIGAAARRPSVRAFLLVSYSCCRRTRAPWWSDRDEADAHKANTEILPDYYKAKIEADELLTALGVQRRRTDPGFRAIDLRPGTLTDDAATGRVWLGKTGARGSISRADVADVAVRLLEEEGANGWVDLLGGEEEVGAAVARVVRNKVDASEGEDVDAWVEKHKL